MEKRGRRGRHFTEVRDLSEANISPGYGVETLSGLKDGSNSVLQSGRNTRLQQHPVGNGHVEGRGCAYVSITMCVV